MEIVMRDPNEVWRSRGRPPRPIPDIVAQAADEAFRSGKCGTVPIAPDEEEEATELMSLLKAYCKRKGRGIRFQRDDDILLFRVYKKKAYKPREKVSA